MRIVQVHSVTAGILNAIPDANTVENCQIVNESSGPGQGLSVAVDKLTGGVASVGSTGTLFRWNDIKARARGFFLANAQEATVTSNTIRVNQTSTATNGFGLLATDLGNTMTSVTLDITSNNFTQLNAATNSSGGYGSSGSRSSTAAPATSITSPTT